MFTRSFFPLFPSPRALPRRAGELLSLNQAAQLSSCIFALIWEYVHIWIIHCSQWLGWLVWAWASYLQQCGLRRSIQMSNKNQGGHQKKGKCLVKRWAQVLWKFLTLLVCTRHWEAQSREWWIVSDHVIEAFTEAGRLHWSWTLKHEEFSRWRMRSGEKGGAKTGHVGLEIDGSWGTYKRVHVWRLWEMKRTL